LLAAKPHVGQQNEEYNLASYINRYVAFLDILGFTDMISRSIGNPPAVTVDEIRSFLEVPEPVKEEQIVLGRIGDISRSGHRLTAFSDSIIITTDQTEQGLMHILQHVGKIGFNLACLGILYRGGIADGLVYHDEQQVFGPAVIDAYELEKQAVFPRVVLSSSVVNAGQSAATPVNTVFGRFTRTDWDGTVFVHYLRVLRMIADSDGPLPDDVRALHTKIKASIDQHLDRFAPGTSNRIKWKWFESYFRWAIDESWRDFVRAPFPSSTGS
jgi:hypothetical protein